MSNAPLESHWVCRWSAPLETTHFHFKVQSEIISKLVWRKGGMWKGLTGFVHV